MPFTCSHSHQPGPLTEGHNLADSLLTGSLFSSALDSQSFLHQGAVSLSQAKHSIRFCPDRQRFSSAHLPGGVSPCGLSPHQPWQMDMTHFPSFVTTDTYPGYIWASAQSGEAPLMSSIIFCNALPKWASPKNVNRQWPSLYVPSHNPIPK